MNRSWIGVDIAKLKLLLFLKINVNYTKYLKIIPRVLGEFTKWLADLKISDSHICLEATGIYGQALAYFMHEHEYKYKISIVNPSRIKSFSTSEGIRSKTDKVDAGVIARFCKAQDPKVWTPPSSNQHELQNLYRCLQSFQEDHV